MTDQKHIHSIYIVVAQPKDDEQPSQLYLVFKNHEDQPAMQFAGVPMKRGDDTWSIRAVMDQPSLSQLDLRAMDILVEERLFAGCGEVYLHKMALAVDTAKYINDQNHSFDPDHFEGKTPNSVVKTLVEAIGLEFPLELEQYWIPGYQNALVPEEWRSAYA